MFQKSSKGVMDLLVTQPIIVHCCLKKPKLLSPPIHLFFLPLWCPWTVRKRRRLLSVQSLTFLILGLWDENASVEIGLFAHRQKDGSSSASAPKFVLQYGKIFYSSCSVLLHTSSLWNSNPQIFESVIENYKTIKYTFPGELRVMWGTTSLALGLALFNPPLLQRKSWSSSCS